MWPEIMVSRVLGGISHWKVLYLELYSADLDFTVLLACILLVKEVLSLELLNLLRSGLRTNIRSPEMPRSTKNSAHVVNTSVCQGILIVSQESSSSDVEMEGQSPQFIQPSTSQSQPFMQPMFMPYIEGPKMEWTVNDSLYHRFLKWKLKCENILECELAMLPDSKKCKKTIVWSGDFGMDQYVSWCLPPEDLSVDVICAKFEDFCKPQTNEVRARFDLLTSFKQGNCSVDEWYNVVQAQVSLAKYTQENASILHRDIFWFFLKDEEFVSKTINDSNIDLYKFPASKVRQHAKKMESSKVNC